MAYGETGNVLAQSSICKPSSKSGADDQQKAGFSDPLSVTVPGFKIKSLSQSSCTALTDNTLYVTLQSTVTLTGKSPADPQLSSSTGTPIFHISGFHGIQVNAVNSSWIQLSEIYYFNGWYWYGDGGLNLFCVDGVKGRALWNASSGVISLALCVDKTMREDINYAFSFRITNPLIYKRRLPVQVSLDKGIIWPVVNMTYPAGCAEPLYIDIGQPKFRTACMNQTSQYAGMNNTLTLSLVVNQAMAEATRTFSIQTLKGITLNSSTIKLYGPQNRSHAFCVASVMSSGSWAEGILNLTLCGSLQIDPYEPYIISFDLVNPDAAQSSPNLVIKAYDVNNSLLEQTGVCKPGGQAGASDFQKNGFADPLAVTFAGFKSFKMSQSSCFASALNTLVVTLQSGIGVSGKSRLEAALSTSSNPPAFSMSRFAGAEMLDANSTWIQLNDVTGGNRASLLFCAQGQPGRATWDVTRENILLTLCADQTMRADVDYVFSMRLTNPSNASVNQTIRILLIEGVAWKPLDASTPGGCANPMHLVPPRCGDGLRTERTGEECDDGNKVDGDGKNAENQWFVLRRALFCVYLCELVGMQKTLAHFQQVVFCWWHAVHVQSQHTCMLDRDICTLVKKFGVAP